MSYWERTKTGRLKAPKLKKINRDYTGTTVTVYGTPVAKVGDYVHFSVGVSAGTVGKVISLSDLRSNTLGEGDPQWVANIEDLTGFPQMSWMWSTTVIPYEAVQEVKDFYIADGRSDRIKVSW